MSGQLIIRKVCEAIDAAQVILCDLTTMNPNVLFELGYAIAKNKRIWILLDPTLGRAKQNYRGFEALTGVGYSAYSNVGQILEKFFSEKPHEHLDDTVYRQAIESTSADRREPKLLYLRSPVETEASIKLTRTLDRSSIPITVDDPDEVSSHPLIWYVERLRGSPPVLAHFLTAEREGATFHNAKNSFVAGLAFGLGCELMMLAEAPHETPIDYCDLLRVHTTARQCEMFAQEWLDEIKEGYQEARRTAREHARDIRSRTRLQQVDVGEYIAEDEADSLVRYFVETDTYIRARSGGLSILIGQKGSGKSAILFRLKANAERDRRKHVCVIKPVAYETQGILDVLGKRLSEAERGFLVESLWKYLIYSEIARSVYDAIEVRGVHYQPAEEEEQLLDFVNEYKDIVKPDFATRLETVVDNLTLLESLNSAKEQRLRISELLHSELIPRIRGLVGGALRLRPEVLLLIDNLDKAWNTGSDLDALCSLLLGLLNVIQQVWRDFRSEGPRRPSIPLKVVVLLRSDIFAEVFKRSHERDKLVFSRVSWGDGELLLRVLEERLVEQDGDGSSQIRGWSDVFCDTVSGLPVGEFILKNVIARPRDLIYLAKTAHALAVNRGHSIVAEKDMVDAQVLYSQYALDSLTTGRAQLPELESLLYEFAGGPEIVSTEHLLQAMKHAGIGAERHEEIIDLLCDLEFLGREVGAGDFRYVHQEEDKAKTRVLARKLVEVRGIAVERFRIHTAYASYLELKPCDQ